MRVARNTLIADSGVLIALFDAREPHHTAAKTYLQRAPQPLLTVDAVVTGGTKQPPAHCRNV
ncbi:MAG: hypothetical protein PHH58_17405, partial [Rhodoferax sp.]|nr:hypothetical protein [Rhodoferax sp.]